MIPLRTDRRSARPPVAVWAVALMCAAALARLASLPDRRAVEIVNALGVKPAALLAHPLDADQALTLVTSTFLHAGWVHLAGNLLYLLVFGPPVLDRLRWKSFLALYVSGGIVGALAHTLAHPSSVAPLVGASGAIAAILGAHLVLEPRAQVTTVVPVIVFFEVARLPAAFVIAVWFALQLASALAPVAAMPSPIAWYAHLGGFALGAAFAAPFALRSRSAANTSRSKRERRPAGRRR